MPFKIAVVGLGKIAQDQHLPCIAKNRELRTGRRRQPSRGAYKDVPSFKTLGRTFRQPD